MTAPAATARQTPAGLLLEDGFKSVITCALYPTLSLWEISTKPVGRDGGEPINITTQHNVAYRTMTSRGLKTLTPSTMKCAYDPAVATTIDALINVETTWTQRYSDGSTEAYYGFLQKWEPDEMVEGTMPTGTATIVPTNRDPITRGEAGPALTSVPGT